ncbi:potassium channel family protein [Bacillus sp. 165]|uniref:potassium channel family protein n=1 Tax=Bacillus sp. 165 TaxID=1529117 RepID=UPI001AD9950D|nr:potassium channel family protein [Bacillus sp. 165]MBO9130668.1 potassium channel protein [Bacillus sp. 165]
MLFFRRLIHTVQHLNSWIILGLTILFVCVSSNIIYLLERETFPTLFDGVWWTMTTMTTVGYGDFFPISVAGRIWGMVVFIVGVSLLGVVLAKVTNVFTRYYLLKESGKLKYNGKGHIIIIGHSQKAIYAIEQIVSTQPKQEIVLIDDAEKSPVSHPHVHYVRENPILKNGLDEALNQANVQQAASAIIFADDEVSNPLLADGKTLLITSFLEAKVPHITTIVEIQNEAFKDAFKQCKVDQFLLPNEMIADMAVQRAFQQT